LTKKKKKKIVLTYCHAPPNETQKRDRIGCTIPGLEEEFTSSPTPSTEESGVPVGVSPGGIIDGKGKSILNLRKEGR
jgi:hypothetical protein